MRLSGSFALPVLRRAGKPRPLGGRPAAQCVLTFHFSLPSPLDFLRSPLSRSATRRSAGPLWDKWDSWDRCQMRATVVEPRQKGMHSAIPRGKHSLPRSDRLPEGLVSHWPATSHSCQAGGPVLTDRKHNTATIANADRLLASACRSLLSRLSSLVQGPLPAGFRPAAQEWASARRFKSGFRPAAQEWLPPGGD
jgi:hypothetical protein